MTLAQAMRHPMVRVNGRNPNASTGWRWAHVGVRSASGGIAKLETARVGGKTVTTPSALSRFMHRASSTAPVSATTPSQVRRAHSEAAKALDKSLGSV